MRTEKEVKQMLKIFKDLEKDYSTKGWQKNNTVTAIIRTLEWFLETEVK